ncbi:3-oxoacyl-[acyl-carrier-protein] synthase 2 [Spirochaetota bacterium]|nr:3-oxoacyl-[acyl-carrier-protein] synthase 2 [Spirochaetota bacterium]
MAAERRVVITGLGAISPLGLTVPEIWKNTLAGRSGISAITQFDATSYTSRVAGEVRNFDYKNYYKPESINKAKRFDKFVHYAIAAAKEAIADSNLDLARCDPKRIGVVLGAGIGGMHVHTREYETYFKKGHKRISPFYVPTMIGNMAAGLISIEHNFQGPNLSVQTACASANHALGVAYYTLKSGDAEVIVSGGSEGIVEAATISGFCNMRALSTRYNDTPSEASRPFDKGRDGFVMGEGSGIIVLETLEHAQARNARIYAELKSVGMSGDAYDMVAPCVDGRGAHLAMQAALKKAAIDPTAINYINCHGTSTPLGDIAETIAIDKLLAKNYSNVQIGSTKSMTGHMIGAAAAIEGIYAILAIRDQVIPPNVNLFDLDDDIVTPKTALPTVATPYETTVTISNSFGFGGHNSCAVFAKI